MVLDAAAVEAAGKDAAADETAAKGFGGFDEAAADADTPVTKVADGTASDAVAPVVEETIDGKVPDEKAIDTFPDLRFSASPMQIDVPGMSFSHSEPIAVFHFMLFKHHQWSSFFDSTILTYHS